MVACSVCSLQYDVSGRTFRDIKAKRVQPRCGLHRRSDPAGSSRDEHTRVARYRRWWLERFTMEEIREMAVAIAPFPSQRAPRMGSALTASAEPGPRELGGR